MMNTELHRLLELAGMPVKPLNEVKLGRVYQHFKSQNNLFAIISAFRDEYSPDDNIQRSKYLAQKIKEKYGYFFLEGFWKETNEKGESVPVKEYSIFTITNRKNKNIFINDILNWGVEFDQEAVLIKQDDGIFLYDPHSKNKIMEFSTIKFNELGDMYSKLKNKNQTFIFENEFSMPNHFARLALKKQLEKVGIQVNSIIL